MMKTFLTTKKLFTAIAAFVWTAVILSTSGCASTETVESTRIGANRIYQDYRVLGNRQETQFYAVFRVNDTSGKTVDLDAPSEIYLDGKLMKENAPNFMSGTTYSAAESGYRAIHQFAFTNADGKIYRNPVSLEAVEFSSSKPLVLHRSQTNFVSLTGNPPGKGAKLVIILSNDNFVKDEKKQINTNLSGKFDSTKNALVIAPDELKTFPVGKATISMSLEQSLPLQEKTATGGQANIRYSSAPLTVQIVN